MWLRCLETLMSVCYCLQVQPFTWLRNILSFHLSIQIQNSPSCKTGYVPKKKKKVSFQIVFLKSEKNSVVVGCVHWRLIEPQWTWNAMLTAWVPPTNLLLSLGNYILSSDWESLKPTSPWTVLAIAFWELDSRRKREKAEGVASEVHVDTSGRQAEEETPPCGPAAS